MRAGQMNRTVTFRRITTARDSYNEAIEKWSDAFSVWAQITTTGGQEFYAAQKLNAETSVMFRVRYNESINERMRIKYGKRIFEILSINNKNAKNNELLVSAKEVK